MHACSLAYLAGSRTIVTVTFTTPLLFHRLDETFMHVAMGLLAGCVENRSRGTRLSLSFFLPRVPTQLHSAAVFL